jgi:hypothetical protein
LDSTYMVGAFVSVGVDGDAQVGGEGGRRYARQHMVAVANGEELRRG